MLDISGLYYFPIYITFLLILVIFKLLPTGGSNVLSPEIGKEGFYKNLILAFILVLFIGTRPIHYIFVDTVNYYRNYTDIQNAIVLPDSGVDTGNIDTSKREFIFKAILEFFALNNFDIHNWFIVVATIYIFPMIWAFRKIFPHHQYLAFLFFLCGFTFWGGAVNGIRNADSLSIFFLGLSFLMLNRNWLAFIICFLLGYNIHQSIIIPTLAVIGSIFIVKNTNLAVAIWLIAIIASLVLGNFIATFDNIFEYDELAANRYLNPVEEVFVPRFRWDFLVYSSLPIAIGYYITVTKGVKDQAYQILLNTYILTNAIWILFMYAASTNRFASLSWALYPFVLCYPMMKYKIFPNNQNTITGLMLVGMIIFNLIFSVW